MLKEFKAFILRGNVIDLAVAVVIGGAFNNVVNSLVRDFLTPLIASIPGNREFAGMAFRIHGTRFLYGDFLNTFISFILIAAVVFFLVVQPINKLVALSHRGQQPDPTLRKCPECMSDIPIKAHRCMYCTSIVKPEERGHAKSPIKTVKK
ncbi:MAG: large conductance mechanosensitive channel protein MscL [Candidatus Saccharimonadales bacterium]